MHTLEFGGAACGQNSRTQQLLVDVRSIGSEACRVLNIARRRLRSAGSEVCYASEECPKSLDDGSELRDRSSDDSSCSLSVDSLKADGRLWELPQAASRFGEVCPCGTRRSGSWHEKFRRRRSLGPACVGRSRDRRRSRWRLGLSAL